MYSKLVKNIAWNVSLHNLKTDKNIKVYKEVGLNKFDNYSSCSLI